MEKMTIKNWTIEEHYYGNCISGNVFGNPKFKDNTYIRTSPIVKYKDEVDHLIVSTENSEYELYYSEEGDL